MTLDTRLRIAEMTAKHYEDAEELLRDDVP